MNLILSSLALDSDTFTTAIATSMLGFQKLIVYQKAKAFNLKVWDFLENTPNLTRSNRDQLDRAAFSIALDIAEGTGRFSRRDRRNFYVISRSSALDFRKGLRAGGIHRR